MPNEHGLLCFVTIVRFRTVLAQIFSLIQVARSASGGRFLKCPLEPSCCKTDTREVSKTGSKCFIVAPFLCQISQTNFAPALFPWIQQIAQCASRNIQHLVSNTGSSSPCVFLTMCVTMSGSVSAEFIRDIKQGLIVCTQCTRRVGDENETPSVHGLLVSGKVSSGSRSGTTDNHWSSIL